MCVKKILKQLLLLTLMLIVLTSVVIAHPGHEITSGLFHGLFHFENILVLFAMSIILFVLNLIKRYL